MKLIDVHSHLQFASYDADREEVIKRNLEELECLINVGADLDSSLKAVALAKHNRMYASLGIHPYQAGETHQEPSSFLKEFEELLPNPKIVAIGEIGLDKYQYESTSQSEFYRDKNLPPPNLDHQKKILLPQIDLAQKFNLPIIFHCREAYQELADLLKSAGEVRGLMHCFMGDYSDAKKFLNLGLKISFCGNLTYKGNGYLREVAKKLPLEEILVETDSPYLTPEPFRPQRNEPRYVKITADLVSSLRNANPEEVYEILSQNAQKLFNLG